MRALGIKVQNEELCMMIVGVGSGGNGTIGKKLRASCDRQLRLARQGAAGTSGSRPGGGSEARDYGTGNVEAEEGRRCLSPATLKEISR